MNSDGGRAQDGLKSEARRGSRDITWILGCCWDLLVELQFSSNYNCAMIMALGILDRKGPIDVTTFLLLKEMCESPVPEVGTLGY